MRRERLSALADIQTGPFGSQLHKEDYVEIGTPIVTVEHLGQRVFTEQNLPCVSNADKERLSKYVLQTGDIVFSRVGSVDRCSYVDSEHDGWMFSGRCLRVRPTSEINSMYLYYFFCLNSTKEFVRNIAVGATMPSINTKLLGEVKVSFPEYACQKKIAALLSSLDNKIELNQKINDNLEQMANQLYEYWFIQFQFPNNDNNPYKLSGSPMVYNSLLKIEIPEGWRVKTVASLLDKVPNTLRVQNAEYKSSGNIPIVDQSASLIAGYTDNTDALLSDKHGYIVFGDHTRVVKYIRFPFARGADGTQILKSSLSCMPAELLYHTITHIDLSNQGYARHFKFLKDSLVIVPNDDIAQKFAVQVSIWHEQQKQLLFENMKLSKLRDWLLPMLMNGQATIDD